MSPLHGDESFAKLIVDKSLPLADVIVTCEEKAWRSGWRSGFAAGAGFALVIVACVVAIGSFLW